jgi:hypothetical protein
MGLLWLLLAISHQPSAASLPAKDVTGPISAWTAQWQGAVGEP